MSAPKWKHRDCPCGCGEMADECMKPSSALNAFRLTPIYDRAAWDHGFAPIEPPTTLPTPCYRCTDARVSFTPGTPTDGLCLPCRGEVAANRDNAAEEVSVYHTGHGINHGTYRADVRMGLL